MTKQLLKSIFNIKRLTKFFFQYLTVIVIISVAAFFITTTLSHRFWVRYESTITKGNEFRNVSLNNLCIVLQCEGVYIENYNNEEVNRFFIRKDNKLIYKTDIDMKKYEKFFYNFTKNNRIIINGNGYKLFLNSSIIYDLLYKSFFLILFISIVPYTIISIYFYIKRRKKEIIANRELKNNMELSLQRNITEMIHHELNAPVALLTSQIDELYFKEFSIRHELKFEPITEKEKETYPLYEDIYFSIDRINYVLTTLARSKHIKFNNGTVPLLLIIKNMESSINAFKLEKIKVNVSNKDILQRYSVVKQLGNGALMNILHILFTNSIEAYSSIIDISCEVLDNTTLNLYIKDNGSGVKDHKGKFIKDDRIFKNGYTTKRNLDTEKGFFSSLFDKIEYVDNGDRGIGLFMVRNILNSSGGNIELYDTSEEGTTFKLTLPIKPTITRH